MQRITQRRLVGFLEANAFDLHAMTLAQFRAWLADRIGEASRHALYQQRLLVRDIKQKHRRRLRDRQRRLDAARAAWEATPAARQYAALQHQREGLGKAIEGLSAAIVEGKADPDKRDRFLQRFQQTNTELQQLGKDPLRKRYDRARDSLDRLRTEIGLDVAEKDLTEIATARGTSSTSAGSTFESLSSKAADALILPQFTSPTATILHSVTLGCPRGEIDQLIVSGPNDSVRVEAVVEAKRNINDLVHGFRLRQENLAWFVGDRSGYDPDLYRTERFPEGRFTGGACHREHDREYCFDENAFAPFRQPGEDGYRFQNLFFVTEERPLLGATSSELGQLLHRAATDPGFDLDSDAKLRRFRKWALRIVAPFQTRDVLRFYAKNETLASQVIFAS